MNEQLDLPDWEPNNQIKDQYPLSFTKHLKRIRTESEQYTNTEKSVPEATINQLTTVLQSIDESLKELNTVLKQFNTKPNES